MSWTLLSVQRLLFSSLFTELPAPGLHQGKFQVELSTASNVHTFDLWIS